MLKLIEQGLTSPPTQYRYQQYQSTQGKNATKIRKTRKSKLHKTQQHNKETSIHSKSPSLH